MTLEEIKKAVDAGKTVHWLSEVYTVIKDDLGRYLIKCGSNYIGLTWSDGIRMHGKEEEFYEGECPMNKYHVEYETKEQHTVTYEIQAKSIEEVQQMIDDGTFHDNATLKYDLLQSSDMTIPIIHKVEDKPLKSVDKKWRIQKALKHLSDAYKLMSEVCECEALDTIVSAIDEVHDVQDETN